MQQTIVLVGNGPSILDRAMGPAIDRFDTVVRFNHYVLDDNLRLYTGSKTDVWAVNEGLADGQQRNQARPAQTLLCVPYWKPGAGCIWTKLRDWPGLWDDGVELIDERAARLHTFPWTTAWASTGLLAIAHFIITTGPVSIIGFDHFRGPVHHYADQGQFCGHHSGFAEAAAVRTLEILGLVTRL